MENDKSRTDNQSSRARKLLGIVKCWEGLEEAHEEYGNQKEAT